MRALGLPLDGNNSAHLVIVQVVACRRSAVLPAGACSFWRRGAQSIARRTQAAPVFQVLEPMDEIRDVFVVGCALIGSSYDEALEVIRQGRAIAAPVNEILADEDLFTAGVGAGQFPILLSVSKTVKGTFLLPLSRRPTVVDVVSYGFFAAGPHVGTLDAEAGFVPVILEFHDVIYPHGEYNAVAQPLWAQADNVVALFGGAPYTGLTAGEGAESVEGIGCESVVVDDRVGVKCGIGTNSDLSGAQELRILFAAVFLYPGPQCGGALCLFRLIIVQHFAAGAGIGTDSCKFGLAVAPRPFVSVLVPEHPVAYLPVDGDGELEPAGTV